MIPTSNSFNGFSVESTIFYNTEQFAIIEGAVQGFGNEELPSIFEMIHY